MFENVRARYALRSVLVGVAALVVSLKASSIGSELTQGEVLNAFFDSILAGLGYAGIGYVSPQVEPNIGNTKGGN